MSIIAGSAPTARRGSKTAAASWSAAPAASSLVAPTSTKPQGRNDHNRRHFYLMERGKYDLPESSGGIVYPSAFSVLFREISASRFHILSWNVPLKEDTSMNRKQQLATHLALLAMLSPGAAVLAQEPATPPPATQEPATPQPTAPTTPPETPPPAAPEAPTAPETPTAPTAPTAPAMPDATPDPGSSATPDSTTQKKTRKHHKRSKTDDQQNQPTPDQTAPQQ